MKYVYQTENGAFNYLFTSIKKAIADLNRLHDAQIDEEEAKRIRATIEKDNFADNLGPDGFCTIWKRTVN